MGRCLRWGIRGRWRGRRGEENKFDEIQKMSRLHKPHDREYLVIMKFNDQQANYYIITVYDSDELWQNPRVMNILKV